MIMVRIDVFHTFPVSASEGFAYLLNIDNWGQFWAGFVRVENQTSTTFDRPGVVVRMKLGIDTIDMFVQEVQKDAFLQYKTRQRLAPVMLHERYYKDVPGGFEYRVIITYEPRKGIFGLLDRTVVKRSLLKGTR